MGTMTIKSLILVLLMVISPVWAAPFDDAMAAHARKD